MSDESESLELFHAGVKGMKWGVRKKRDAPELAEGLTKRKYDNDKRVHGRRGANRINERMKSGMSRNDAYKKEERRNEIQLGLGTAAGIGIYAFGPAIASTVASSLDSAGSKAKTGIHNAAEKKRKERADTAARNIFADERGLTSYRTVELMYDNTNDIWAI